MGVAGTASSCWRHCSCAGRISGSSSFSSLHLDQNKHNKSKLERPLSEGRPVGPHPSAQRKFSVCVWDLPTEQTIVCVRTCVCDSGGAGGQALTGLDFKIGANFSRWCPLIRRLPLHCSFLTLYFEPTGDPRRERERDTHIHCTWAICQYSPCGLSHPIPSRLISWQSYVTTPRQQQHQQQKSLLSLLASGFVVIVVVVVFVLLSFLEVAGKFSQKI